jgi:hypothetical protein
VRFFRKQDQRLEDRLRSLSAEPREEFVRDLAGSIRSSRARTPLLSRRVLVTALTSAALLIPFAAFGGIGYAAQAAKGAAQSVSKSDNKGQSNNNNQGNSNFSGSNKNDNRGDDRGGNNNGGHGDDEHGDGHHGKPDDDQYKPGKGCGDKNHEHEREHECKKPPPHDHH